MASSHFVIASDMRRNVFKKQACQCQHAKTIHYVKNIDNKTHTPCHFPNCNCKDYRPAKTS